MRTSTVRGAWSGCWRTEVGLVYVEMDRSTWTENESITAREEESE